MNSLIGYLLQNLTLEINENSEHITMVGQNKGNLFNILGNWK